MPAAVNITAMSECPTTDERAEEGRTTSAAVVDDPSPFA